MTTRPAIQNLVIRGARLRRQCLDEWSSTRIWRGADDGIALARAGLLHVHVERHPLQEINAVLPVSSTARSMAARFSRP
jgi:hypothetical protein